MVALPEIHIHTGAVPIDGEKEKAGLDASLGVSLGVYGCRLF
jgi:hypothetical protein